MADRWEVLFRHEVLAGLDGGLPVEEELLDAQIEEAKGKAREDLMRVYCSSSEPWKEVGFRV